MALIKCPNCDKQISDKAKICPHCNEKTKQKIKKTPTKKSENKETSKRTLSKKLLLLIPLLIVIVIVIIIIVDGNEKSTYSNSVFSVKYPSGVGFKVGDNNEYYFYPDGQGIPYVMLHKYDKCVTPKSCVQKLRAELTKKHPKLKSSEIDTVNIKGKEFVHVTLTYNEDGNKVTENEYFKEYKKSYSKDIWGITTKEIKTNDKDIEKILKTVADTLEVKNEKKYDKSNNN